MGVREDNVIRVEFGKNIRLSEYSAQRLEASVQKAILAELAKFDLRGDLEVKFPHEWYGIWLNGGPEDIFELDQQRFPGL